MVHPQNNRHDPGAQTLVFLTHRGKNWDLHSAHQAHTRRKFRRIPTDDRFNNLRIFEYAEISSHLCAMKNRLSQYDAAYILSDYRRGCTITELAEAYGCSKQTIARLLKANGCEIANDAERRETRERNTYNLETDVAAWLRVQPDIEAAINRALRMAMEAEMQPKVEK